MKYKIGDRVKVLENGGCNANITGKYAKIINIDINCISLEFEHYDEKLHSCLGIGKKNHCWNFSSDVKLQKLNTQLEFTF